MEGDRSAEMSDDERDRFLGTGGTGVISFSAGADGPPYAVPVSYGYDPVTSRFYFRLAFGPESGKRRVVGRPASFVVYGRTDAGWRSVRATGTLEEVTEAAMDSDVVDAIRRVSIPLVDAFDRHPREVTFRFFRLLPDELTGRREAAEGE
ncbi:MAG: pyridoxamine 5'-phosphate oxidase family protein [Salinigranum sp.]